MTLENGIPITTEVLGFLEKNTFFIGMYFRISLDDVLVSCYTNTERWLAHSVIAPFTWFPNLLFGNELDEKYKWTRTVTDA